MTPLTIAARDRVLIIAPHPDDESLSCAGLIQRGLQCGARLRIIFLTNGENNPWPHRIAERRIFVNEESKISWGKRRQIEAGAATSLLGLNRSHINFWGYPDQGLHKFLLDTPKILVEKILIEINEWKPSIVVSPSQYDLHPDHNAVGLLMSQISLKPEQKNTLFATYLVHHKFSAYFSNNILFLELSENEQRNKKRAILLHASQMILSKKRFTKYAKNTELFFKGSDRDSYCYSVNYADKTFCRLQVNISLWKLRGAKITIFSSIDKVLDITLPLYFRKSFYAENNGKFKIKVEKNKSCLLITLPEILLDTESLWIKFHYFWNFLDSTGWQLLNKKELTKGEKNKICCIIPCYNVQKLCGDVIRKAAQYAEEIIVVNDGSTDQTHCVLDKIAGNHANISVLTHLRNQGKGAALLAAFRYALQNSKCGIFITLDGDAQHSPEDIPKLAARLREVNSAMVIGERDSFPHMPLRSRIGNEIISCMLRLICPNSPKDTQSGFRAHSREFIETIIQTIEGRRYETELYILLLALNDKAGVTSVSIPTVYLENNASSHFNPLRDSLRIFGALLFWCGIRFIKK